MECDEMVHKDLNIEDIIASHKTLEEKHNYKFRRLDPNDTKIFIFKIIRDKIQIVNKIHIHHQGNDRLT